MSRCRVSEDELDHDVYGTTSNIIPDIESLFDYADPVEDEPIKKGPGKFVGDGTIKVWVESC